jgi:hypothetical protein
VRLHGLLKLIVIDHESNFTSKLWKIWFPELHLKLIFSTSCHSKTNGETKNVNQRSYEDYLHLV